MSEQKQRRPAGRAIIGAKVTRMRGQSLPETPAGGNVQITLDDGSRFTAWKGTTLFKRAARLRDGDEFDFTYARELKNEYPNTTTGETVVYTTYDGVEIIEQKCEIGSIRKGAYDELPDELSDREEIELVEYTKKEVGKTAAEKAAELAGAGEKTDDDQASIPQV